PLLHILSGLSPQIPIVFLNTGYLFPETLTFRDSVASTLGLRVVDLRPDVAKSEQRTPDGRLLFASDPDRCCHINKVVVLDAYLRNYDVWISGVRAQQTSTRGQFQIEQQGPHSTLRYHPILDWTSKEIYAYRKAHDLPEHPLDVEGYESIGCMPCTVRPFVSMDPRAARWAGTTKTECGIHTELAHPRDDQR
ncbi:MAG: phosphoadenylyl-sulfate reductase, partial [Rhodothermales bacterium]|nr:phosphoadenylyl-sulfate reductase [Rhodothermales bacterium]